MVASIPQILGKVNPRLYAENASDLIKEYGSPDKIPAEKVKEKPLSEHVLAYDSATETLEPVYFFILDMINDFGFVTEKLIDNFSSSPGSGHFSELGQRATVMQQQGTKLLGDVNTVLRSTLNIIYDLKEFRIRLSHYDHLNTANKDAAILALKQIWMDKVDMNKGRSSIKAMSVEGGFQTLIDAFLVVKEVKDVDKIDLNDRVKRILRPRILEFNDWLEHSEVELRKRYQLERDYLKSQVNSLKLYSRWAKPYLLAAGDLEMKSGRKEPALVKAFNTIILELTLLGKQEINVKEESIAGNLPAELSKMRMKRKYYSCVLVDFKFRGIPQRVNQQSHYSFGGRADISFKSYVLNDDELEKMEEELGSSDIEDILKLVEGITTGSLSQLQEDIEFFLNEEENESKKNSSGQDSTNPFKALFGGYNQKQKPSSDKGPEKKKGPMVASKESFIEKEHLRPFAEERAKHAAFNFFDIYKKSHGMVSYTSYNP